MRNRMAVSMPTLLLMAGLGACAGDDEVEPDEMVLDTIVEMETELVEVPVPDSSVITSELNVEIDTVDIGTR